MSIKSKVRRLIEIYQNSKPRPITVKNISCTSSDLLHGRGAFVTGGTSGIGFAIADAFLSSGAKVIISGRSQERINQAVEKLQNKHLSCKEYISGVILDVKDVNAIETCIQSLFEKKGFHFDILVNNAGIGSSTFPYISKEDFDNVIDTNLRGATFCAQMFSKYIIQKGFREANILNIASSSSLRPANSPYILSKWGIRGLTLGLAKSLYQYGITVNAIAPGPTATPMLSQSKESLELKTSPLGRFILPEEIANMAVVMVSPLGRSIIGDTVYMTGGAGVITLDDIPYTF